MFSKSQVLAFAFAASLTGVAAARQPPALVQSQAAASTGAESHGYRDMLTRPNARASARYEALGYRDSLVRLGKSTQGPAGSRASQHCSPHRAGEGAC